MSFPRTTPVPSERGWYTGYPCVVIAWETRDGERQVYAEVEYPDGEAVLVRDDPNQFSIGLTDQQRQMRLDLEAES
jgi:hypothetical protein